jgi:HEAT repeat protein
MKVAPLLAVLALLPASAAGHGAVYFPPPSGPVAAPPKVGLPNPATPLGPGLPQGGGTPGVGPGTLGGLADLGVDRTRWTWWWEFHRAPYLDLRRHVLRRDPRSGGDGLGPTSSNVQVPTPERIRAEVLPALQRVLAEERNPNLLSSALVALARVADDLEPAERADAEDRIRPFLGDGSQEVSEAAVLALGVLGHEPSAVLLAALARDAESAHALVGGTAVPGRLRSVAAFGLGLLASASDREDVRRYAVHELSELLSRDRDSEDGDLEAACVLALGIVPLAVEARGPDADDPGPPAAGRGAQIAFLEAILADRRRDDLVRAQVPLSLARLAGADPAEPGRAETLEPLAALRARTARTLLDRLAPMRREPNGVLQASVVGLGLLIDNDDDPLDTEARRKLRHVDTDVRDRGARRFARIALARIAGRDGDGDPNGVEDVRRFLLSELARGRSDERAWAALALGVLERSRIDAGRLPDGEVAAALRDALTTERAPDDVAAVAVALGLLRDPGAESALVAKLRAVRDDEARGLVALALGMVGARAHAAELSRVVDESGYRPLTLREAATGLALLGDKEALPGLLEQLRETRSLAAQAALAEAIGRVGDARSFAGLAAMISDESVPASARAFAAVALGLAGDLDPLPWSTPLSVHGNHITAPVTLYDDVGLGVLNIL